MSSPVSSPPPPFSPAFEASLATPVPTPPPLSFDPVAFVSAHFPSSPALQTGNYAGLTRQVNRAMSGLSKGRLIKADSSEEHTATLTSLASLAEVCAELLESVKVMKELEEATRLKTPAAAQQPSSPDDYQALDAVRRHLVTTVRSLRSLSLLISATDALPLVLPTKDYAVIARLLAYITQLTAVLSPYAQLPILALLGAHLSSHLLSMQRLVLSDLYSLLPALPPDADIPRLTLAVSLLDTYTPSIRAELTSWFASARLQRFVQRLSSGAYPSIERVEDMYRWLYAELSDYEIDAYDKIFPASWYVPAHLVRRWVDLTLQHVQTQLADLTERQEKVDLYKPLQCTMALEEYLAREVLMEKEERDGVIVNRWEWKGALSSAFLPYIHTFVVFEQERLSAALQRIDREEQWAVEDIDEGQRLAGFDGLLGVVEASLARYQSLIHNETMFGLFKEYKRVVVDYVKALERHIPAVGGSGSGNGTVGGVGIGGGNGGAGLVLTKAEVCSVIRILNTADYVLTRLPSLVTSVQAAVDAEYAPHVSFEGVAERVAKVHVRAHQALVLHVCNKADPILLSIKDSKKDLHSHPGEESAFVRQLVGLVRREVGRLQQLSSYKGWLQAFLSKFLSLYVMRVKGVGHIGDVLAEQLLIDTQVLRAALSALPGIEGAKKEGGGAGGKGKKKGGKKAGEAAAATAGGGDKGDEAEKEREKGKSEEKREEKEKETSALEAAPITSTSSTDELKQQTASSSPSSSSASSSAAASSSMAASSAPHSPTSATAPASTTVLPMSSSSSTSSPNVTTAPSSSSSSPAPHPSQPSASLIASALSSLQSDLSSAPASSPPTDPYLTLIHHHLHALEKMLHVLSSPTPTLIPTFRRLFPKAPSSTLTELMDLRGLTSRDQEKLVKLYNASIGERSAKRVDWVQKDFMTNFFGDIKKTINTNL